MNARYERPQPPHLRPATGKKRCGNCEHFAKGACRLYANFPVAASEVCDSYSRKGRA